MASVSTASTELPAGVTPAQAISALHNHDLMIKSICPQLISYTLESGDASSEAVYQVTDKKPIGQTTYKLTLTNKLDGLDSLVNAKPPIGSLDIASKWRVVDGKLVEEASIDGNMITKKMGRDTVTKEHPKAMEQILVAAAAKAWRGWMMLLDHDVEFGEEIELYFRVPTQGLHNSIDNPSPSPEKFKIKSQRRHP